MHAWEKIIMKTEHITFIYYQVTELFVIWHTFSYNPNATNVTNEREDKL